MMTKTQAREFLSRVNEAAADARRALAANDVEALTLAVQEIGGCAGTIESALDDQYGEGLRGLTEPGTFLRG